LCAHDGEQRMPAGRRPGGRAAPGRPRRRRAITRLYLKLSRRSFCLRFHNQRPAPRGWRGWPASAAAPPASSPPRPPIRTAWPTKPAACASTAGEDTFTYGLMYQRQACQAASIEQALPRFAGRGVIEHWLLTGTRKVEAIKTNDQDHLRLPGCPSAHRCPVRTAFPLPTSVPRTADGQHEQTARLSRPVTLAPARP